MKRVNDSTYNSILQGLLSNPRMIDWPDDAHIDKIVRISNRIMDKLREEDYKRTSFL